MGALSEAKKYSKGYSNPGYNKYRLIFYVKYPYMQCLIRLRDCYSSEFFLKSLDK